MRTPDSWDSVFLDVARQLARRSKDDSTQVGAVVVSPDHRILGTGFNGPPPQIADELVPWSRRPEKYAYILHADENAVNDARRRGADMTGATVYLTGHPCPGCLLRIIEAGITRVVYDAKASQPKMVDPTARETCRRLLAALKPGYTVELQPYEESE